MTGTKVLPEPMPQRLRAWKIPFAGAPSAVAPTVGSGKGATSLTPGPEPDMGWASCSSARGSPPVKGGQGTVGVNVEPRAGAGRAGGGPDLAGQA